MIRKIWLIFVFALAAFTLNAQQTMEQEINSKIVPPLQPQNISQQLAILEQQLIEANREAEFWRSAKFYNDKKRERTRMEKLVYWSQRTVQIRNQITKLKQDRSYYQNRKYDGKRFYYQRD